MNNIFLNLKRFYKNKVLLYSTLIFGITVIIYTFLVIYSCFSIVAEPLDYLAKTLDFSIFTYVFFMFISYEYLHKIKQVGLEETLHSIRKGYYSCYITSFSILGFLAMLLSIFLIVVNISIYYILDICSIEYFFHIIYNIILNIFAVSIVGIIFGGVLSFSKKTIVSYILMLLMIIVSSPLFDIVASSIYMGTNQSIYPIYDFFNIFPPLLNWSPITTFGYSLLSYRVQLILFWILFFFTILLIFLLTKNKKRQVLFSFISIVAAITCLVGYFKPASKVTMSNDPYTGALADVFYYSNNSFPDSQSNSDFIVEKYNMVFNIDRNLEATAILRISNNNLTKYRFTLYHGYKVESVLDVAGEPLEFEQKYDYITVETAKPINEIIIKYSGAAVKFFSNKQGVSLPGWFVYYPQPGHLNLFNNKSQSFERVLCLNDAYFVVTVNSPRKVYCNLDEIDDNTFSGVTNGLTIVSGFYESYTHSNIEVIYPFLATNEFSNDKIQEYIEKYVSSGIIGDTHRKILVIPNTNLTSVYERFCEFSDHITLYQFLGLPTVYDAQKLPSFKLMLRNAFNAFNADNEYFEFIVSQKEEAGIKDDVYVLLHKVLNELSEDFVKQQIENYLNDESDKRESVQFLNDLLR